METRFLRNFNERLIEREEAIYGKQDWIYDKLHIISFIVPESGEYVGKPLRILNWGRRLNIYVVKIRRNTHNYVMPKENAALRPGDKVYVVGEQRAIMNFYKVIGQEPCKRMRTLRDFMDSGYPDTDNALSICAVMVTGQEAFAGKTIKNSHILREWGCMVLGIQKEGLPVIMPNAGMTISGGDILWVVGSNNNAGRLASEYSEYDTAGISRK